MHYLFFFFFFSSVCLFILRDGGCSGWKGRERKTGEKEVGCLAVHNAVTFLLLWLGHYYFLHWSSSPVMPAKCEER